ncbi:unnamed protein product [Cercopithifilaria johnstoni]|uniref:Uncharacterized protein n=1 Tax=Cercopithifilaria johnstoni TaxID=2874296 RepID=A0A8J2PX14_9BILA|nr:unnamed protein product [Cercopithifilaria johnstoni]
MFLQWLLWYTVAIAVSATEFDSWRKIGSRIPWYLSSTSGSHTFTNYDSNGWKPYSIIDDGLPHHQMTTYNQNSASQLLGNGELLWNIRNVLQKLSSQININDLHPIWNSIKNGELSKKIEMFLQQQQQERQSQNNGYDTLWKERRRFMPQR